MQKCFRTIPQSIRPFSIRCPSSQAKIEVRNGFLSKATSSRPRRQISKETFAWGGGLDNPHGGQFLVHEQRHTCPTIINPHLTGCFPRKELFQGKARAAFIWSTSASILLAVLLFVVYLVADLLETRGRLAVPFGDQAAVQEFLGEGLAESFKEKTTFPRKNRRPLRRRRLVAHRLARARPLLGRCLRLGLSKRPAAAIQHVRLGHAW